MVTDGEISPPDDDIKQRLAYAHEEMGLEVRVFCPCGSLLCSMSQVDAASAEAPA